MEKQKAFHGPCHFPTSPADLTYLQGLMKFTPLLTAWGLLLSPLVASETAPENAVSEPPMEQEEEGTKASAVPEPNTLIVAGIGSLAILLFAKRRK